MKMKINLPAQKELVRLASYYKSEPYTVVERDIKIKIKYTQKSIDFLV